MTETEKNDLFKKIFKKFNYGLYVLGGANSDSEDLIICSWVMQSTYNDGEVVINIDGDRPIYSLIQKAGIFTISVLGIDNLDEAAVCALSSEERKEKLGSLNLGRTSDDIPYLNNSLAYFECNYTDSVKMKSNVLLVGTPVDGEILSEGESLTLHDYYKLLG